jgi:hypothetical protein
MAGARLVVPAAGFVGDAVTQSAIREEATVVDKTLSQPDPPTEPTDTSDTPSGRERLDADLLNGGSGQTSSPTDPPNQGADPTPDDDLLHGGSGEPDRVSESG